MKVISKKYHKLISTSARDPVNEIIHKVCDICKRDYMTEINLGDEVTFIYTCKCGNIKY